MSNYKKIVLIDPGCMMIDSLYKSNLIKIDTLLVSTELEKNEILAKYKIENILTFESINDFYLNEDFEFDYNIIKLFKTTEVKVQNFLSRVTSDINSIQYIYYRALFYWIDKFKNNDICGVMSSNVEFGSTFDSVIFDVADYFNKKIFVTEVGLSNGKIRTNQLFNYVDKNYLPINYDRYKLKGINKNSFLFNSVATNAASPKKIIEEKDYSFKSIVRSFLYKRGGFLLVGFPIFLLGKFNSIHHSFNVSWWTYFKNFLYMNNLKKYYSGLCSEFNSSQKYIYFPLHMEPEAATQNRTISSNQLLIIKSISQNLPEGWILYVKEHPHQYANLNKVDRYYYLSTINKFRTKRYYNEIKKIKNVQLLSVEVNSKDILEKTQAVATINGTIILESLIYKKPVLAFSQSTTPFIKICDIYNILNDEDCKKALCCIKNGFSTDYSDFDAIIENYFYLIEDNEQNNFCLLIEDLFLNKFNESKSLNGTE